jgi:2,4-dienoyl-CoA reductase-like NADH-dependent reductase (Old Yellow Enzyme family)
MTTRLADPVSIGTLSLRNRLYRAPVLEGAGRAADPAAEYARHFVANARAGVGLVIQGNTIVRTEGRTSPGMSCAATREDLMALAPMTAAVKAEGARIVVQLGHGGLFALESWHRAFRARRTSPPMAPSAPPWWLRPLCRDAHVPGTREVEDLVARFGVVASWAREAGYDGVQLAGANAKLLHQFLSSTYNRRKDRFGGGIEGRARILVEIREAIAREAGADYPVLLKYTAEELGTPGGGITLAEGVAVARLAAQAGFAALTPVATGARPDTSLCRGDYPEASWANARVKREILDAAGGRLGLLGMKAAMWVAARRFPFRPVWNRDVFRAVKAAVDVPVLAVGGIRTPAEAGGILGAGEADLVGVGRPFYAEPDLARAFLAGREETTACESCNRCVVAQMVGLPGVCYNPRVHRRPGVAAAPRRELAAAG